MVWDKGEYHQRLDVLQTRLQNDRGEENLRTDRTAITVSGPCDDSAFGGVSSFQVLKIQFEENDGVISRLQKVLQVGMLLGRYHSPFESVSDLRKSSKSANLRKHLIRNWPSTGDFSTSASKNCGFSSLFYPIKSAH